MRWTLIVSSNDLFQRQAIAGLQSSTLVAGVTGTQAAIGMVRGIEVGRMLLDGTDEVGLGVLAALRSLPPSVFSDVEIVVVGVDDPTNRFRVVATLEDALIELNERAA